MVTDRPTRPKPAETEGNEEIQWEGGRGELECSCFMLASWHLREKKKKIGKLHESERNFRK